MQVGITLSLGVAPFGVARSDVCFDGDECGTVETEQEPRAMLAPSSWSPPSLLPEHETEAVTAIEGLAEFEPDLSS